MKINEVLEYGSKKLNSLYADARNMSKQLLAFILEKDTTYLKIHIDEDIQNDKVEKYKIAINELIEGRPLQYITHSQGFMGLNFYVDEDVLIPQPDTEILVEEVIHILKDMEKPSILDLCTGSGAIAVSIKKYIKDSLIDATDISEAALRVAKYNAKNNDVDINFIQSDLFENIDEIYDLIVSNPPYIKTAIIETLPKEVRNEPYIALDGGKDGLKFYTKIISKAKEHLKPNGYLALEIGFDQKNEVIKLLKNNGYVEIYSLKDYGNNDRVVVR